LGHQAHHFLTQVFLSKEGEVHMDRAIAVLISVVGVLLIFALAIALVFAGYAISGYILMLLWNWLVPALFQGPVVTFWQSVGLIFLLSILGGALGLGRNRD
jgi:hypothetical protein